MNAKFKAENPDAIEMTLTVTMTLREWVEIKNQLPDEYPAWHLASQIQYMVNFAERHFCPDKNQIVLAKANG